MSIKKVRIKNFRSIVSAEFEPESFNVLVGSNDSGKSNFLRALNLFFNNEVEIGTPFRFARDFSRTAKTGKGKAQEVRIELEIDPPSNYSNSKRVVWRKTWRTDSSNPSTEEISTIEREEITGRSKVGSWLDAHRFHYVPAVRGSDYFRSLMRNVHDSLAEAYEDELRKSSSAFIKDLRSHTKPIGQIVKLQMGLTSEIQLPSDLRGLFEVLDFETDDGVSLRQRGDGIQAAHIPAILKFIADSQSRLNEKGKPKPTFIWGYEEPENNLEFSRAFSIAEQLNDYSTKHQIFLTTHSPAFYTGKSKQYAPKKWLVGMTERASTIRLVNSEGELDSTVGLMPLVAPFIQNMQVELDATKQKLEKISKPTIFVSGTTDEQYIIRAIEVFFPKFRGKLLVKQIGNESEGGSKGSGDGSLDKLIVVLQSQPQLASNRVVVLFDCDAKGKKGSNPAHFSCCL